MTTPDPLELAAATLPLADPVAQEGPREGDPGGPPCSYCALKDGDAIWSNPNWRVVPRSWSPIPGGAMLLSRAHVDTLSEMPSERQAEFGQIAAAIERAIMALGDAARVHLYRWGDGRAHFHVHFVPRPKGRPQFGWRNLPFLEERYPDPGPITRKAAADAVGRALSRLWQA
jgi:diadenosine tetraphosphate (Ap4A) HIT family hydrolase